MKPFYVTTPIYYVNDRPHIGHVYTTTLADVLARYHRMMGRETFFLTGVDEHAAKVQESAAERGLTPQEWADRNAEVFREVFRRLQFTNDDFIRTTEERHKSRVIQYVRRLLDSGDVYAGEYEGWYDAGQEEYVSENKAKETGYLSPINRKPLVRKKERNYFFALSRYQERLQAHIEANPGFIRPEARRNEVLARIREGLNDVPISRTGSGGWGIPLPGDPEQSIYVWIDALFNYRTAVDCEGCAQRWPADVHLLAKDILWFHAVIWPVLLMALGWPLPIMVYVHSFWISEGQKMSKSLGNFIDLEEIEEYVEAFGLDALRYYLVAHGPQGVGDSDFARRKFVEVYNSELANDLGNTVSRVLNMTKRYFQKRVPALDPEGAGPEDEELRQAASTAVEAYHRGFRDMDLQGAVAGMRAFHDAASAYIVRCEPWSMAKDPEAAPRLATVMHHLLETLRLLGEMIEPIMPTTGAEIRSRLGLSGEPGEQEPGRLVWGGIQPGAETRIGKPLFPRIQTDQA